MRRDWTEPNKARHTEATIGYIKDLRQREALPVLNQLKQWMQEQLPQVTPSSAIGKAIAYSLERWDKLCIYIREGGLLIDNNGVENSIRPIALAERTICLPAPRKQLNALP